MKNETDALMTFKDAVVNWSNLIIETLTPIVKELVPAMQAIYDAFWQAYRDAGRPYGETNEGLMRWVKEVNEARRLQFEAERILQHHQMLADFRTNIQG